MVFVPTQAPVVSEHDVQELAKWTETELQRLAQLLQEDEGVPANELHVAPDKPREGQRAFADGTDWNPGSGRGPYMYVSGAWTFTGYVAPQDLTPYLTKADNLASVVSAATSRSNLSAAAKAQDEYISGTIKVPANQDYRVIEKIPYGATLTSFTGKLSAGTLTATLKINTTAVMDGALSATTSQGSVTPSAANVLSANDLLVVTISAVASAMDFSFTVKYSRTLA